MFQLEFQFSSSVFWVPANILCLTMMILKWIIFLNFGFTWNLDELIV